MLDDALLDLRDRLQAGRDWADGRQEVRQTR